MEPCNYIRSPSRVGAAGTCGRGSRDIWSSVDLRGFAFTSRIAGFEWKLLHGVDAEDVVRSNRGQHRALCCTQALCAHLTANAACAARTKSSPQPAHLQTRRTDVGALEALLRPLQEGDPWAEPHLSAHNHIQARARAPLHVHMRTAPHAHTPQCCTHGTTGKSVGAASQPQANGTNPKRCARPIMQVFRLIQLAVDWLWQLRDCHVKLFAAAADAGGVARRWAYCPAAHAYTR